MSNYSLFEVKIDWDNGNPILVPEATIQVRNITDPENIIRLMPDLEASSTGVVAAGSLAVDAGSIIRFSWFDNNTGICGFAEDVTS